MENVTIHDKIDEYIDNICVFFFLADSRMNGNRPIV